MLMCIVCKTRSLGLVLVVWITFSGCSVFLPPHRNSLVSADEKISMRMLTLDDIVDASGNAKGVTCRAGDDNPNPIDLVAPYQTAFGVDPREYRKAVAERALPLAALATFVAGLAVDAVVSQLRTEATRYEAQFSDTRAFAGFWKTGQGGQTAASTVTDRQEKTYKKRDVTKPDLTLESVTRTIVTENSIVPSLEQNYLALEVTRSVNDGCAFLLVIGIAPSPDQQMFRLAPLVFVTNRTKAKVLGDEAWTWLPPMVFGKLFRAPGHHIDSEVNVQIDAYWRGSDQQLHTSTVAAIVMKFLSYNINRPQPRLAGAGSASGWLLAMPVSYQADGRVAPVKEATYGTFSVKVVVTERDKSNAKRLLEEGATLIKEHKADIIKQLPLGK